MPHTIVAALILCGTVLALFAVVVAVGPLTVLRTVGGLLRRHRWQLTPLFTSTGLAAVTIIGYYRLVWPLSYTLTGLPLIAALAAAAGWRQFRRATDRAYILACTLTGVGLAVTGVLTGPTTPLAIIWTTATGLVWVPWLRHTRVQARIDLQRQVEGWPQFAENAGIAGAKLLKIVTIVGGRIYRFRRPFGMPHSSVDKRRFNDALDARPGTVTEIRQPTDMSSRVTEVVVLETPQWGRRGEHDTTHPAVQALPRLEESLLASLEARRDGNRLVKAFGDIPPDDPAALWVPGQSSCTRPKLIGYAGSGETLTLTSWAAEMGAINAMVVGVNRSGKTNTVQALLASTMATRDEVVWVIELAKSGAAFYPWRDCLDWVALDADTAEDMLTDALAIIAARPQERVRRMAAGESGVGDKDRPSRRVPLLTILVDEAAVACANYTLLRRMVDVARTGPESAVRIVIVPQRCDTETIPAHLRSQLREVTGLRMDSRDVPLAFPDHASAVNMDAFRVPGSLIIASPTGELSPLGRSCTTNNLDVNARLSALYAPYRPTLESAALQWTQHYATRNQNPFEHRTVPRRRDQQEAQAMPTPTIPSQPGTPDDDPVAAYAGAAATLDQARQMLLASQAAHTPPIPIGALIPDTTFTPPPLDDRDREILRVLADAGTAGVQISEVARAADIHRSTALARLQNLQAGGLVRSAGKRPAGVRWYIAEAGNPNA